MNSNEIDNDRRKIRYQKVDKDSFIRQLQHCHKIEVTCTPAEQAYLQSVIPGELAFQQKYVATHARPRALSEIANHIADRRFGNKTGRYIEIGANLSDFRRRYHPGAHACLKIEDGRDQTRALHTAFCIDRKINFRHQYTEAEYKLELDILDDRIKFSSRHLQNSNQICVHGTEHCAYKAPVGVAIHALYDITPEQLYQAFYVHEMWHLTSFHHVMPMVKLRKNFFDSSSGYWYQQDYPKKGLITFGFSGPQNQADNSHTYTHCMKNYRHLVFDLVIHGADFSIIKETQMKYGFLHEVRFSRITLKIPRILMRIDTGLQNIVIIPDLQKFVKSNYRFEQYTDGIIVDKSKYYQVKQFCESRSDDDIGYTKASQYARAIKSEITIGDKKVLQHWEIDEADFTKVIMFAYVHSMIDRFKRSKLVGVTIKEIVKEIDRNEGFFSRMRQRLADFFGFLDFWRADCSYSVGRVLNLCIECMKHIDIQGTAEAHIYQVCPPSEGAFEYLDLLAERHAHDPKLKLPFVMTEKPEDFEPSLTKAPVSFDLQYQDLPEYTDTLASTPPYDLDDLCELYDEYIDSIKNYESKPELEGLNEEYRRYLSEIVPKTAVERFLDAPKISILNGGPGTGKTTYAIKNYVKDNSFIIVPTSRLKEEWKCRLESTKFRNVRVYTFQTAIIRLSMMKGPDFANIIVDEAFMFAVPYFIAIRYLTTCEIFLLGDPKQINFIDFSGVIKESSKSKMCLKNCSHIPSRTLNYCYRCPKDVVAILNKNFGYRLCAKSAVEHSIVFSDKVDFSSQKKDTNNLFFTQFHKTLFPDVIGQTVHEAQGSTRPHVTLTLTADAMPLVTDSKAHLLVGITRHTQSLVCMSENEQGRHLLNDNLGYFGFCVETQANVKPHDAEKFENIAGVCTSTVHPQAPVDRNVTVFDPSSISQIFVRTLKPKNDIISGANDCAIPAADESIKIVTAAFNAAEHEKKVRRFAGPHFGQTFRACDRVQALRTLVHRYGQKLKTLSSEESLRHSETFYKNFENTFIKEWSEITEDDLQIALAEYAQSVKDKKQEELMREFELQRKEYNTQFVLKEQVKAKVKEDAVGSGKAGQGIGAWNKSLNTFFCVYFRAAERALIRSFKDFLIYANGYDDQRFWQRIQASFDPTHPTLENDFTEFDSCQNMPMLMCSRKIYGKLGMPQHIIDLWVAQRSERMMVAPGFLKMKVINKKDSGEPATLLDNDCVDLMLIPSIVDIEEPDIAGVKGDDIFIQAKRIEPRPEIVALCEEYGIKAKVKQSVVPQFCAHFISPNGVFIDIPSRTLKLFTKTFMNNEFSSDARHQEFHDYKIAVADWLKCFSTQAQLDEAILMATQYYKDEFDFAESDVRQMATFLYGFCNADFTYEKFRTYTVCENTYILNLNSNHVK
nr:MAG: non-structural polyprotein [Avian associated hepe-like virus 17]